MTDFGISQIAKAGSFGSSMDNTVSFCSIGSTLQTMEPLICPASAFMIRRASKYGCARMNSVMDGTSDGSSVLCGLPSIWNENARSDGRAEAWATWRNLHEAAVLAPRLVNGGTGWARLRLECTILARILFYARGGCASICKLGEGRGRVVHERLGERGLAGSFTRCRAARAYTL